MLTSLIVASCAETYFVVIEAGHSARLRRGDRPMRNVVLAAFAVFSLSVFALPAAHAATFNNSAYQSGYDNSLNSPGQVPN
jgi:hypothetical protein